jgi:DNA-binding CsgD family transcriptional regulator
MMSAELAFEHQDYPAAARNAQAAVAMCGAYPAACPAGGLRILAIVSLRAGLGEQALAQADAALAAAIAHAEDWEQGLTQVARATVLARSGLLDDAQRGFETALSLLTGSNGWGIANALYGLGSLARARGDNAGAQRRFRAALEYFTELGARTEIARCLAGLGWVALAELDVTAAAVFLAQSLELSIATGQRLGIARGIEAFAALSVVRADDAAAARLEGAAAALREIIGPVRSAAAQDRLDGLLSAAHHRLGPARTAELIAEGRLLTPHLAARYALRTVANVTAPGPAGLADVAGSISTAGTDSAGHDVYDAGSVLTTREHEIALLIARGLSNRGIGEELFISPATAARHVANIFAKLGLNSRAQVAAWVVSQHAH